MLQLPPRGFIESRKEHKGHLDVHADWIEASVLFAVDQVSQADFVDALIENNTYNNQDFAYDWVSNVFRELERRFSLLGHGCALIREGARIRRLCKWEERSAYAFCVALTMVPHYRKRIEAKCGKAYTEQGALFERLCAESLRALHWEVAQVGWSRSASNSIQDKVNALAAAIGEPANDQAIQRWAEPDAKDGGLDLVAWKEFPDGLSGRPICLVQVASGENWADKLHTPNVALWAKLIDFATRPRRGLAMPFAPEKEYFRRQSNHDLVMLLMDRHRILSPTRDGDGAFPSQALASDLINWTQTRVAAFPLDDE